MNREDRLTRIFAALSVPTRLRIIHMLKQGALCVGALSSRLGITQGAVSQHLRILRHAELVVPEKRGYYVHYRLNEKTLSKWRTTVFRFLDIQPAAPSAPCARKGKTKGKRTCERARKVARSRKS
jgi:ArsR family transcriptional regulator